MPYKCLVAIYSFPEKPSLSASRVVVALGNSPLSTVLRIGCALSRWACRPLFREQLHLEFAVASGGRWQQSPCDARGMAWGCELGQRQLDARGKVFSFPGGSQ